MANVPVIKIPVDASDFEKFKTLFDQYREQLKEMPGAWGATNEAVTATAEGFVGMTAALMAQAELSGKVAKNEEKSRRETERSGRAFKDMAKATKTIASDILHATTSLLKWTGIVGSISGLLGAGGLFGIDRLAAGVGASRRSAAGLGGTIGEQKAFEVNYGKFIGDPDNFLQNINSVAHDYSKQWGVGSQVAELSAQGKSPAQIAADLLPSMVDQFVAAGGLGRGGLKVYDYQGLSRFGSFQDFQTLARTRGELGEARKGFDADKKALNLPDDVAKSEQDLARQLHRAGEQIETILVRGLVRLNGPLEHLSATFVKVVGEIANSPKIGHWLDDLSAGLEKFAGYLDTPAFGEDVKTFIDDMDVLVHGIQSAIDWFRGDKKPVGGPAGPVLKIPGAGEIDRPDLSKGDWMDRNVYSHLWGSGKPQSYQAPDSATRGDLLHSISWQESRDNPNAVSPAGAKGEFQFMDSTARQYGLSDPFDPKASAKAASRLLDDLSREFGGDLEKELAAYNWGAGNVEKDIAKYGAQWKDHLPAETKSYVAGVERNLKVTVRQPDQPPPRIVIQNQTGGSAIMTSGQIAI